MKCKQAGHSIRACTNPAVCPRCLHPPHADEEGGTCGLCAAEVEGGQLPARAKCTERCPLPGCRGHPGKRGVHRKEGCALCAPGEGCNALAAAVREAAATAAAAAAEAVAEGAAVGVAAGAAAGAAEVIEIHGEDIDFEQIEAEAEEENNEALLRSMYTSLGSETMGNFVDLVADAQGSTTDELGAVVLELEYLQEEEGVADGHAASD
mmetsp:Transcript_76223/g.217770  ORF Transcript_76223/g.217770 Transcript_76223/m.217770 type:complete len:208 (-) Transcript_76223:16-639(-)